MYTKSDLMADLAHLGINPRGTLLVHSSMKAIGPVEDGADTVRLMLIQPEEPLLHALEDAAAANQQ